MASFGKFSQFNKTAKDNTVNYIQYFDRLTELSISMFEYKNLPDTVDERYLELALFHKGQAVFFKDEEIGYLALRCTTLGDFDVYGIPNSRTAFAVNGYHKKLTKDDSVIIYNNMLHKPSCDDVREMARKLYDFDQTISVNAKAQKTPVMIICDEEQRLTMKNLYMQYDGNQPYIFGNKTMKPDQIKALKTDAPFIADKIYQLKTQYWNEALTYLGISNLNIQKKERMVADEVTRNQGGTIASRYSRLESRRDAVDKINKMFGLNIEVNYRPDYREADDETMLDAYTGGKERTAIDTVVDLRTK